MMMDSLLPSHALAHLVSLLAWSAEEYWEMGAIQVHPCQRSTFQEGKKANFR